MGTARRGFAAMTPEQRQQIARMGGKAVHAAGKAHHWTAETAKIAGRKGGLISRPRKRPSEPSDTAA